MKAYNLISEIVNTTSNNLKVMDRQRIQVNTLQAQSQRAERDILKAKKTEIQNKQKMDNIKKQMSLVKTKPAQVKTISTAQMAVSKKK